MGITFERSKWGDRDVFHCSMFKVSGKRRFESSRVCEPFQGKEFVFCFAPQTFKRFSNIETIFTFPRSSAVEKGLFGFFGFSGFFGL